MYQSYEGRTGAANAHVHPTFADALRIFLHNAGPLRFDAPPRPVVTEADYRAKLAAHDWTYEWSDDHSVWQRGHDQRHELRAMQREIDPDFAIWNQCCHPDYRNGAWA